MKKIVLFVAMLCAGIVNAAVIRGTVVNETSGLPLASATVTFRIDNPSTYPVATTDGNGRFSAEVAAALSDDQPPQFVVEKNGYVRKIGTVTVNGDTVDLGTIALKAVSLEAIMFMGTVVDSITQVPVEDAKVSLTKIQGAFSPQATVFTGSDGTFRELVTLSDEYVMVCTVSKAGYISSSVSITAAMDSVIRTIRLRPEGSIRLSVGGRVVDFRTGEPVSGARVIALTNYHGAVPDTSYTDNSGVFMRSVQAGTTSSAIPTLIVIISTEGNPDVTITRSLVSIDFAGIVLGEITITSRNSGDIVGAAPRLHPVQLRASSVRSVVTLNGRLCRSVAAQHPSAVAPQLLLTTEAGLHGKAEKTVHRPSR